MGAVIVYHMLGQDAMHRYAALLGQAFVNVQVFKWGQWQS